MLNVRLDWLVREVRQTIDPSECFGDALVDHYSIPALERTGGPITQPASEIESGKQSLSGGEVLISRLNPRKGRVLRFDRSSVRPAICSGEFVVLRPLGIHPGFLTYLLMSETVRQLLDGATQSVTRSHQRVRPETLLKLWIRLPNAEQQASTSDYLDTEIARIDALIEKKQRLVDLLEARRRIVVSEGVSGNSPRVGPRLRHVSHLVRGSGFPHEKQGREEGDLPFFKVGDLSRPANNPFLLECENWISHETALELRATIVPPDSVMFPKIGAALAGGVRRISTIPSVCDNNVLAVVPSTIEARYLRYWLSTVDLVEIANPGPVPSLDDDALKDLRVPITDRGRQSAIADHLDSVTQKLNSLTTQIRTQLLLLRERRQALITAAVTGDLEVPGVAA